MLVYVFTLVLHALHIGAKNLASTYFNLMVLVGTTESPTTSSFTWASKVGVTGGHVPRNQNSWGGGHPLQKYA